MNGAGTASSPRLVSSTVFYGDEPSPRLLAHFLERTLGALDGVGKGRRCPGAAGGTSDVRRSGRTEKLEERLLVWCLRNNYTFAAMDFGRRPGASDEHIPQWICKERATTPPPKRHAALRVALKLAWGFVAQSVEYRCGYTPSFAPRPRPI
jgi:hypothetical protein